MRDPVCSGPDCRILIKSARTRSDLYDIIFVKFYGYFVNHYINCGSTCVTKYI